jgi:FdhD protein
VSAQASTQSRRIRRVSGDEIRAAEDRVAVEEPLEIRLAFERTGQLKEQSVSITMRTPGHDEELALGFLYSEGLVAKPEDVQEVGAPGGKAGCNIVRVELRPGLRFDPELLVRHFYTTSSCGVCGKASIEALRVQGRAAPPRLAPRVARETITRLPEALRRSQAAFQETGGLHAAGLFDAAGRLLLLREDVGRHNAIDKVVGRQFMDGRLPLYETVLVVSGRTSFEIMQKAVTAGVPIVAAVGAPSSLAVELAERFRMTLVGFVRETQFNIYAGPERIVER